MYSTYCCPVTNNFVKLNFTRVSFSSFPPFSRDNFKIESKRIVLIMLQTYIYSVVFKPVKEINCKLTKFWKVSHSFLSFFFIVTKLIILYVSQCILIECYMLRSYTEKITLSWILLQSVTLRHSKPLLTLEIGNFLLAPYTFRSSTREKNK